VHTLAAYEVNFVTVALTEWKAQLSAQSYKQATRKWLVGQGYSQTGGIITSFEAEKVDPCEWVTKLRMLQGTCQLGALVEQVEAENTKKAESVAQLLPRQQQRRGRRGSVTLLSRMASSSPKPDIRGVGQQVRSCVRVWRIIGRPDTQPTAHTPPHSPPSVPCTSVCQLELHVTSALLLILHPVQRRRCSTSRWAGRACD
jgi:hypothetical protein